MKKKKIKDDDFIKIEEKEKVEAKKEEETKEEVKEKKKHIKEVKEDKKEVSKEKDVVKKPEIPKSKTFKHPFTNFILVLVLLSSVAFFILSIFFDKDFTMATMISNLILITFTLLYVTFSITVNRKNKSLIFLSGLLLLGYYAYGSLLACDVISFKNDKVINFTNMELTEVIKWSEANKIEIVPDYEYSDMILEYHVISQDIPSGTKIKDVDKINISISEGPSPYKEIMLPNMVSWDSERVLEFIKNNYLSNVKVEFQDSSSDANTVIEQSINGNIKRNDEIKLVFSYGPDNNFEEVKLRDLSKMSKFEAEFYLKQNKIKYNFEDVFSSKIKKNYVVKQSIKAGTMVKVNDTEVIVSLSKGPEVKIPNLKGMTMSEITEWVIDNKLKLEFKDKYDDSIEENAVISANYKEGDVVSEGTEIVVTVSRGKLVMPKFNSYNEFKEWAEKYEVRYEEQREFNDSVKAGEVIKYSYNTGETIKNNDAIVVTVSNGKSVTVPSVVGLTKDAAASKLKSAGFGYSFVYSYSSSVAKGKVIKQSISSGSKIAEGTTITVTVSNGPKPAAPACVVKTFTVSRQLNNVFNSNTGYDKVASALNSFFATNYPGVKISVVGVADTGMSSGSYVGGIGPGSEIKTCTSSAYQIKIAK